VKLSIAQKGLLLATLPLVFEMGFVGKLSYDLIQTERQASRITNRREVAAEASRVLMSFFTVGSSILTYGVKGSSLEVSAYERLKKTTNASLEQLKLLSKNLSDDDKRHVEALESRLKSAVELIGSYITEMTSPAHHPGSFDVQRFRRSLMAQVEPFIDEIVYFSQSDSDPSEGAGSEKTIIAGVLLNVVFAMLLVVYFSKTIKNRISVLQQNASRFQKGQMLKGRLRDEDEISSLDKSFHDMADRLTAANLEMREYYLELNDKMSLPLSSLKETLLALSESKSQMTPEGRKKLEKSAGSVDRLVRLISELTMIDEKAAKSISVQTASCSLNDLITSAITSVADYAAKREIEVAFSPPVDITIRADKDRVIQVLVNLLSNALKFSPQKSAVEVRADISADPVVFHVIDKGPGIRDVDRARLFQKYEQADNAGSSDIKGSGLGLSICREIIEAHGGSIGVESVFGEGSDFWFRLPRS